MVSRIAWKGTFRHLSGQVSECLGWSADQPATRHLDSTLISGSSSCKITSSKMWAYLSFDAVYSGNDICVVKVCGRWKHHLHERKEKEGNKQKHQPQHDTHVDLRKYGNFFNEHSILLFHWGLSWLITIAILDLDNCLALLHKKYLVTSTHLVTTACFVGHPWVQGAI